MNENTDKMIVLGIAGAPHGVRGEVRIKVFTGDPLALGDYGPLLTEDGRTLTVADLRPSKNVVVARFREVRDRTGAEALTGQKLLVPRDALPDEELDEDEFFVEDLIGAEARLDDGSVFGQVRSVHDFGAGAILEIAPSRPGGGFSGKTELFAFTRETVPELHLDEGWLLFVPPGVIEARQGNEATEGDEA